MANRLSRETSLYLRQHKDNPIDWWPYGSEPFDLAQKKDLPIFISIGYSSCHWCHVMARESFEDPDVAKFMNRNFINIKIDREEHPGIDKIFQDLYQLVHQKGGGWPLSVWLTPNGDPIYLGTYFPNKPRHGLPSFIQVSQRIAQLWKEQRETVIQQAKALGTGITKLNEYILQDGERQWDEDLLPIIVQQIANKFDWENGGIGHHPKFPHVSLFRFLLYYSIKTHNKKIFNFVKFTYLKMRKGGIYDQLKGGFARYSVDEHWLVPHFEKMLYDNAELIKLASELWQLDHDDEIRQSVFQTISWLKDDMMDENGAFYASMNAESEHREGKHYVWKKHEIDQLVNKQKLTPMQASIISTYFGITEEGNFTDPHHPEEHGMNVLSVTKTIEELVKDTGLSAEKINGEIAIAKEIMLKEREKRIKPDIDTKIITSWNSLLISSLFTVSQAFGDDETKEMALTALNFLLDNALTSSSVLRIVPIDASRQIEGILEDYAFLARACLDAYETTGNFKYVTEALKITRLANKFYDFKTKNYFLSKENILDNPIDFSDTSIPSPVSVMLQVLYKLGKYMLMPELIERGALIIDRILSKAPEMGIVLGEFFLSRPYYDDQYKEIVEINEGTLIDKCLRYYLPIRLVYRWVPKIPLPKWPAIEGRTQYVKETIFICEGSVCSLPITSEKELHEHLNSNSFA